MRHKTLRLRIIQQLTVLASILTLVTGNAAALSATQNDIFDSGVYQFDNEVGVNSCPNGGGVSVPPGTLPSVVPEPYNGAFTAAGAAYKVSPVLLAAIFTEEHFTNQDVSTLAASWQHLLVVQPDPNSGWATSPDQAMGPFQFIPSSWASLGVDANHDGKKDPENLLDASFGAANYAATDGATADKPKAVWVNFADGYSGHTGGYADHVSQYIDYYSGGATGGGTPSFSTGPTSCNIAGPSSNKIVQYALMYAWDDYPTGHNRTSAGESEAKPEYVAAVAQYEPDAGTTAASRSSYTLGYTDCGAFVATVIRASGADPNYPQLGSFNQLDYVQANKDKYTVYQPGGWSTTGSVTPQPGDIFITDGHTYLYVGPQSDGYSVAEASATDHVPEVDAHPYTQQTLGGVTEKFYLVRMKN